MNRLVVAVLFVLAAASARAQVAPGNYISERGFGSLEVENGKFAIVSVGGNGHTCAVEGSLNGATGRAEDEGDVCLIAFTPKGGGYEVKPTTPDTCRNYCGMRAYFEGLYLKPAPGCADKERESTQKAFTADYKAKRYSKAEALLARQLKDCAKTLGWLETAQIRNDLAIAQFHLGRKAACLKTLAPLAQDADKKDDDLSGDYPPSDWESYQPLVKAARTNLRLCRG